MMQVISLKVVGRDKIKGRTMSKLYEYSLKATEVGKILMEPKLVIPTATSDKRRHHRKIKYAFLEKRSLDLGLTCLHRNVSRISDLIAQSDVLFK